MKKMNKFNVLLVIALVYLFLPFLALAQAPAQFKYQAVLRDATGNILTGNVEVVVNILENSVSGNSVFSETHHVSTTPQGVINLNVGSVSDLSKVDFSADNYFIKISVNGTEIGISQLLSVPYALHAKTVVNLTSETPSTGDVLTWNGSEWLTGASGVAACITKLPEAPDTYCSVGNYQFRYNSTEIGGYIEVRSLSGYDNMMVFCTKSRGTWDLGGTSTVENYRHNISVSPTWSPLMTLWDGAAWDDRVMLSTYDWMEATMHTMGNGSTLPSPLKVYRVFAAVDGYNQIIIRVEYNQQ